MPIIVATESGLEIDGILLKNAQEMQLYIEAHSPATVDVSIGMHQPADLYTYLEAAWKGSPTPLYVYLNILDVYIYYPLSATINMHSPEDLDVYIGMHPPSDLQAIIDSHLPQDLDVDLYAVPYKRLDIIIDWIVHHSYLEATVKMHSPWPIDIPIGMHDPEDFLIYMNPMSFHTFIIPFLVEQTGEFDLGAWLKCVTPGTLDLEIYMHIWSMQPLSIDLKMHDIPSFSVFTHVWTPINISAFLDMHFPNPLGIEAWAEPEPGSDLIIYHASRQMTEFFVEFDTWDDFTFLSVNFYGFYESLMNVIFTMGAYRNLSIDLPGTSGYRNLFVTIRPSSRIMSTFIPIYTMEIKDIFISINQGWPCGFYSTYSLLEVVAGVAYLKPLDIIFAIIDGSGYKPLGIYLNKMFFDTYFDTLGISLYVPEEITRPESIIPDSTEIVYDNEFLDLYQEVLHITFPWPRFKLITGFSSFSVELYPFYGDKIYSLEIYLVANRQQPPIMPTSQPLQVATDGYGETIWPDVFQVKEIELWSLDPPELVRRIEVMFDEQVKEYYWVSQDQRAYSKNMWERWAFLTRGYLPHAEYSGQIQYETLRTLSSMKRYSTIDEAVRAMLAGFLYSDAKTISVSLLASGGYNNMKIFMDIWGWNRLKNLNISLWPVKTSDLSIELQAV